MTTFDPELFKDTTRRQWDDVAERWNAWGPVIDRWLGPATDTLLDMAGIRPGDRVLHIAGGSGQDAIFTSRRVGPSGAVLSTDFSERLTRLAEANFVREGVSAEARVMDGEDLPVERWTYDACVSRVGLIFFPDKERSLARQRAAVKPGGVIAHLVYAEAADCPFFSTPVSIIRRHAGLPAPAPSQPGPFSLGAPGAIEALYETAGLVDVETRRIEAPLVMGSAAECLRFEQESFGALHQMLAGLDEEARTRAWAEVGEALTQFEQDGRFEGPCVMIAAVGRTTD